MTSHARLSVGSVASAEEKRICQLQDLQAKGRIEERTAKDYLAVQGSNPDAVDRMGLQVLLSFRRKMFVLLSVQCACVSLLSWAFANIPMVKNMRILYETETLIRDGFIVVALWTVSMLALCVLGALRYKHPHNKLALVVFSVFMSMTLAAMAGPNVHLGMSMILLGVVLVGIMSSVKFGNKVLEVFPVTFFAMIICNIIIVIWMFKFNTFMAWGYVLLLMLLNTVGLTWAGYEIDRLCSRLKVDEYMMPVILLWAELLVMMLLVFSVESMVDASSGCTDGCHMWSYTYWHCDCWLYSDGTYGKEKYRPKNKGDAPQAQSNGDMEAPKQEQMAEPVKQEQAETQTQQQVEAQAQPATAVAEPVKQEQPVEAQAQGATAQ